MVRVGVLAFLGAVPVVSAYIAFEITVGERIRTPDIINGLRRIVGSLAGW
jgi:hypothetical protein